MKKISAIDRIRHALADPSETRFNLNHFYAEGPWVVATDGHRLAALQTKNNINPGVCVDPETGEAKALDYPDFRKVVPIGEGPLGIIFINRLEWVKLLTEIRRDDRLVGYHHTDRSCIQISFDDGIVNVCKPAHAYLLREYEYKWTGKGHNYKLQSGDVRKVDGITQDFPYGTINARTTGAGSFLVDARYLLDALNSITSDCQLAFFDERKPLLLTKQGARLDDLNHLKGFEIVMPMKK